MIVVNTLNMMVRKALPNKSRQATTQGIIEQLPIAPSTSGDMEILILGPTDFRGAAGQGLAKAIASADEHICIIYLCTNEKEKALCPSNAHIKQVRKITPDEIKGAVTEFYGKDLQTIAQSYSSAADKAFTADRNPTPPRAIPKEEPAPEPQPEPEPELVEEPASIENPMPAPPPIPEERPLPPTPQQIVESARSIEDFEMLRNQLKRDSIMADALLRSSEFQGIQQMMSVFSVKMQDTMADPHLTNEQKLAAIREFGNNRSSLAAAQNSRLVSDFLNVWSAVVSTSERIVKDRLDQIETAVIKANSDKASYIETVMSSTEEAEKKYAEYALELINIWGQMTSLYRFAYGEATEGIAAHLNDKLPSDNEYINSMLGKAAEDFYTANSEDLVSKLFKGLQEGRISMTQVQDQCQALISMLFQMVTKNQEVMGYHREIMDMLRANNVESVVVRDTLLKDCFRVFVGTKGTGLTATTIMYAGMMRQRGNTLVIDLSGHGQYKRYGFDTVDLSTFMGDRIQRPLTIVTSTDKQDPEQIAKLLEECKGRMSYYSCLIVVLDASQTEELDQIGREALTINYVTDCSADSMDAISACYNKSREIPNVGSMLCTIDAPVDAATIVTKLGMDVSRTRLVLIPYVREVKKAAIVGEDPSAYNDTRFIYEQAFRV